MPTIGNRSGQFRHIYSNSFGIQAGGNEVVLSFGFKDNPHAPDDEIINEVGIVMLPVTLKFLAQSLTKLVDFMEKTSGTAIPLDAAKIAKLDEMFAAAATSPTASEQPS